jgi:hypothetical protein
MLGVFNKADFTDEQHLPNSRSAARISMRPRAGRRSSAGLFNPPAALRPAAGGGTSMKPARVALFAIAIATVASCHARRRSKRTDSKTLTTSVGRASCPSSTGG